MEHDITEFLSACEAPVIHKAGILREMIKAALPGIIEQLDIPAKMIAYAYSQKYADMICVIIPSQKGVKLGFSRGSSLPDPKGVLKGSGKLSRYIEYKINDDIDIEIAKEMLAIALKFYREPWQPFA